MSTLLPPFRLYGLVGCPHCGQAEAFLRSEGLPAMIIVANDDPIAEAGVKSVLASKYGTSPTETEAKFPMLVCTFGKRIVEGWKEDEYRGLAEAWHTLSGTSAPNPTDSGQQPVGETAPQAAEASSGVN